MLEIYDDEGPVKWSLKKVFGDLLNINAALVHVNLKGGERGLRIDRQGLTTALSLNPEEAGPIVLYSFESEESLCKDVRFRALMGKRGVGFVRLPFNLGEVITLIENLRKDEKEENILAIEMAHLDSESRKMSVLKHDLGNALRRNKDRVTELCEQARQELGLAGTDEEITQFIMDYEPSLKGRFEGRFLPGVFCDIEGTLLIQGNLNSEALELLDAYAKEGKSITLWTGSDIEEIRKLINALGLKWQVVSKWDLAGTEVEIAIDDEPENQIEKSYNIRARNFVHL